MLQSISIKNIALIEDITINLGSGLNVITGETGAGKSLVIDSISLLLGDKADRTLISYDKDYAYVEAVFTTNNPRVFEIMAEFGIDKDSQIVVARKLYKEGKNECRVNGKSLTLAMLKKLTAPLMDLHGQFEHQSILNNDNQLAVIDGLGGETLAKIKAQFAENFERYQEINRQLSSFTEDDTERNRLIDLYDFQIKEITDANFVDGEEESLKECRAKVLNMQKIAEALEGAEELATYGSSGTGGIAEELSHLLGQMGQIRQYSASYEEIYNRLDSAKIEIADIVDTISAEKDNLEFNEFEAKQNEERLDLLSSFKKKYGKTIEEINAYLQKISAEADRLKNAEDYIADLKAEREKLVKTLTKIGQQLTSERKKVAKVLAENLQKELGALAMKNTTFVVDFIPLDLPNVNISGMDRVEYMFSANAGQPPKPLNKIISGGEMSRFMLAVKNITADIEDIDTMIFDEIDTGVSGNASEKLAQKLLAISKNRQVICVSHLSQVASYATNHYYISKAEVGGKTRTSVQLLEGDKRVAEVARLIGGAISSHSIEHAKFMINSGKEFLASLK